MWLDRELGSGLLDEHRASRQIDRSIMKRCFFCCCSDSDLKRFAQILLDTVEIATHFFVLNILALNVFCVFFGLLYATDI